MIKILDTDRSLQEIQDLLGLKHRGNFRKNYIEPSLNQGVIEMRYAKKPNHPDQKYRLTVYGSSFLLAGIESGINEEEIEKDFDKVSDSFRKDVGKMSE